MTKKQKNKTRLDEHNLLFHKGLCLTDNGGYDTMLYPIGEDYTCIWYPYRRVFFDN